MRKLAQVAVALACAHAAPSPAAAWIADAGRGNGVQLFGVGTALLDRRDVKPGSAWVLDRMWIARAAYWKAEHPSPFGKHLWDVSLMPTLRIAARGGAVQPFVEAGIGAHLLSATQIDDRRLSTAFQLMPPIKSVISCGLIPDAYSPPTSPPMLVPAT